MSRHTLNPTQLRPRTFATSNHNGRCVAWIALVVAALWAAPGNATPIYSETFDGPAVPSNWTAQNGTQGLATLAIADDTGGINTGDALSIESATRQGVIGEFSELSLVDVGDTIELCFDLRLTQYADNAGGFRFGLYHDNDGLSDSSGYRALLRTGSSGGSLDVQADGGDTDIAFGTNRQNPPGYATHVLKIDDTLPHALGMTLTRTSGGVTINVSLDGVLAYQPDPLEHATGGTIPIQTSFNQIAFTTNGGYTGLIDNVQVKYTAIPEPASLALVALGTALLAIASGRSRKR
ncbi:PEP-CTERM sorting domain-containing protein [Aeoliella sp.]|uniref:PEP-CTERM sorting domain-containing protein n=1 Tax=Aeoliella sp. TaxID=2795800 RepID=UPI003CCC1285